MGKIMKGIITTIPLEPKDVIPSLGILSSPIFADYLSRGREDLELKIALNILESNKSERPRYTGNLVSALGHLGISSSCIWLDEEHLEELYKFIEDLNRAGRIKKDISERLISSDKKIEVLEDIAHHPRSRFYEKDGKGYLDKKTGKQLIKIKGESLFVEFLRDIPLPKVYPKMMEKEVATHLSKLNGDRILVSRLRETGLPMRIGGTLFNLDVDLVWGMYLNDLMRDKEFGVVVGSNHTTWHSCLSYALYHLTTGRRKVSLVLLPYIVNPNQYGEFIRGGYLKENPNIARLIVLNSYSNYSKNVNWQTHLLNGRSRRRIASLKSPPLFQSNFGVERAFDLVKKFNIERGIKTMVAYDPNLGIDLRGMLI